MRVATCRCGGLQARCCEEPIRVSVCHCLECQRRTGSAFSTQARFAADSVVIEGEFHVFDRTSDSGARLTYQFCPSCGSTIADRIDSCPDVVAIPLGAFADDAFPSPVYSIYERRKRPWVDIIGAEVEHHL